MKKIINGKMYNIETATHLATFKNSGTWHDFRHYEESLYRKRTGEYFLFGEGGPMTSYATPCGQNEWEGGIRITPMSEDAAKAWLESHATAEQYIAIFGEPEE